MFTNTSSMINIFPRGDYKGSITLYTGKDMNDMKLAGRITVVLDVISFSGKLQESGHMKSTLVTM